MKMDSIIILIRYFLLAIPRQRRNNNLRMESLPLARDNEFIAIKDFIGSVWSNFLFCFWSSFSVNISVYLYTSPFAVMEERVRRMCWVVMILEIIGITGVFL